MASSDDEPDERLALVLQSATTALAQQEATLDNLRARSATLLAAAALSSSFLGAATFGAKSLNYKATTAVWVAVASLLVVLAAVIYIGWPRGWDWRISPSKLLSNCIETKEPARPAGLNEMRRELALDLHGCYKRNEDKLKRLWKALQIGSVAIVVEVVAWLWALAVR